MPFVKRSEIASRRRHSDEPFALQRIFCGDRMGEMKGKSKKSAIAAVLSAFPAKCRRHFAGDSIYGCMNSLLCAKEYLESSKQRYMCLV